MQGETSVGGMGQLNGQNTRFSRAKVKQHWEWLAKGRVTVLASVQFPSLPSFQWVPTLFTVREGRAATEGRWMPLQILAPSETEVSDAPLPNDHIGYGTPLPSVCFNFVLSAAARYHCGQGDQEEGERTGEWVSVEADLTSHIWKKQREVQKMSPCDWHCVRHDSSLARE